MNVRIAAPFSIRRVVMWRWQIISALAIGMFASFFVALLGANQPDGAPMVPSTSIHYKTGGHGAIKLRGLLHDTWAGGRYYESFNIVSIPRAALVRGDKWFETDVLNGSSLQDPQSRGVAIVSGFPFRCAVIEFSLSPDLGQQPLQIHKVLGYYLTTSVYVPMYWNLPRFFGNSACFFVIILMVHVIATRHRLHWKALRPSDLRDCANCAYELQSWQDRCPECGSRQDRKI